MRPDIDGFIGKNKQTERRKSKQKLMHYFESYTCLDG